MRISLPESSSSASYLLRQVAMNATVVLYENQLFSLNPRSRYYSLLSLDGSMYLRSKSVEYLFDSSAKVALSLGN